MDSCGEGVGQASFFRVSRSTVDTATRNFYVHPAPKHTPQGTGFTGDRNVRHGPSESGSVQAGSSSDGAGFKTGEARRARVALGVDSGETQAALGQRFNNRPSG